MPAHPEHPGVFDDYTEQRFLSITEPLAAEHHTIGRVFEVADEVTP